MKALEEKIVKEGSVIGTEIVKVDSFLNHQIDSAFLAEMGSEFARLFAGKGINKVITVESSGIAIACAAAQAMGGLPVVFAKKTKPSTLTEGAYTAEVRSFTKGTVSTIMISDRFLGPEDRVLIIDDFLATGEASLGLTALAEKAGAKVVGVGIAIEKEHQGGAAKLRQLGLELHSLAVIKSIKDGKIEFSN